MFHQQQKLKQIDFLQFTFKLNLIAVFIDLILV